MKVVIPMAGLGTRFAKVADTNPEYKKPKPFISVKGIPMVRWATGSLPFVSSNSTDLKAKVLYKDLIFIVLKEHDKEHNLVQGLYDIYSKDINVITLDAVTRGAAETALKAKEYVDENEELIVTDSDHYFDGTNLETAINNRRSDTAGIIPVFVARNEGIPKWSYSLIENDSNTINQVGEKDRSLMEQGAHANIGSYYFSKAKYFFDAVEDSITHNKRTGEEGKAEFYVAPLYQELINKGHHVEAAIIPEVWGLGTPSDLEYFLDHCPLKKPMH